MFPAIAASISVSVGCGLLASRAGTSTAWDVPLMLNVTMVAPRSSLQVARPQAGLTPYITGGLPTGVKEVRSSSLFASEANMSTDTSVVLCHGARLVRCTLPILVGLLTLAAPLVGQARHGHFYHVNYYQVRPGQEKAYDSALVNVVTPVFDELVKRKAVVSYLFLTKIAGSGENTHVVIVEVVTPSAEGTFQRELDAASH